MLDIDSKRYNFFDKTEKEMWFAVKCSSTLDVFMHVTKELNMLTVSSPPNIKIVFYFFPR